MDIVLYLVAIAVLIVLILFALKVRMKTQEGKLTPYSAELRCSCP